MNKNIISPLVLLFMSVFVYGQQGLKNTVILYNVVPLRVDLNPDGTIQTIYGQDNKFLKGYTVVKPAKTEAESAASYGTDLKGYKVVASDAFDLPFKISTAILSQENIDALDKISNLAFFKGNKIVLSSYKVPADNKSQTLFKNRINAILAYLDVKNVSKDKIIINADEIDNSNESFKITFVE
jgi:hypothetical protein